jgi:hypothetical protein
MTPKGEKAAPEEKLHAQVLRDAAALLHAVTGAVSRETATVQRGASCTRPQPRAGGRGIAPGARREGACRGRSATAARGPSRGSAC